MYVVFLCSVVMEKNVIHLYASSVFSSVPIFCLCGVCLMFIHPWLFLHVRYPFCSDIVANCDVELSCNVICSDFATS